MAFMAIATAPKLQILQAADLKRVSWLVHGFSTRPGGTSKCYGGGNLNLGYTKEDSRESVEKNRSRFLLALGAMEQRRPWPLITLKQIHSDVIHIVRTQVPGQLAGDGLVTNVPQIVLAVQTADCFPVLLVDQKNRAVGAFHAGWRGTVKRIVEKGLGVMQHAYGTQPQDVHVAIGPGIRECCYEVGEEVRSQFESQFAYDRELFRELYSPDPVRQKYPLLFMNMRPPGHGDESTKLHLDLAEANRRQLLSAGVPESQISVLKHCTSCNRKKFFSHRAEKGTTGRMMAVVAIRKPDQAAKPEAKPKAAGSQRPQRIVAARR
jgi:YfiH family protein